MKHLGDITLINGGEIEPVDCITFGSPCTRLSTAGRHDGFDVVFVCKAGLDEDASDGTELWEPHFTQTVRANDKYQYLYEMECPACGSHLTATNESALFFHAVRILEEMRSKTNGKHPAFAVWENVPGAFSSSKGEDFRTVLEELAKVCDSTAAIPRSPDGRWRSAGCIMGDGWSIAWRVLDAQFWGVPQRRARIALVVDFGGGRAPEILFERQGLPGHTPQSRTTWKSVASGAEEGAYPTSRVESYGFQGGAGAKAGSISYGNEIAPTLDTGKVPCVLPFDTTQITSPQNRSNPQLGAPCHPLAATAHPPSICIAGNLARGSTCNGPGVLEETAYTLNATDRHSVFENHGQDSRITGPLNVAPTVSKKFGTGGNNVPLVIAGVQIPRKKRVRRLMPLECDRLQGYPDNWTNIGPWVDTKGKLHKESSDTARYQADGNSIAIPVFTYVMDKMAVYLHRGAKLGSLFDGIGGFPLIWERIHGKGKARWASEIEEFPIAVTKYHFGED